MAYVIGLLLVLVAAGEITARMMGYRPYKEVVQSIEVTPAGRFYQDDSLLGYKGKPGEFDLLLNDSLRFHVSHDAEGWRKTGPDSLDQDSLPEIWMLGCSFTHGYGVGDAENYPAILQQRMPSYRIRNYGMDGYGTLQNYLLLQDLLARGKKPFAVVLGYGGFHDQRNTANRYWHKALHGQRIADDLQYPYARLDAQDSLHVHYGKIGYHPFPFQRMLALASLIEERWNRSEEDGLRSKAVTEVLIQRMVDASHDVGAHFVMAGIYRHPDTHEKLKVFAMDHVPTIDISQDLDDPALRILPGNGHPNAAAHARMAASLHDYLVAQVFDQKKLPNP